MNADSHRWAQGMEEVEAGSRAEEAAKFKRSLRKTLQRLENVLPNEMKIDEEVRMGTDGMKGNGWNGWNGWIGI